MVSVMGSRSNAAKMTAFEWKKKWKDKETENERM
jgi:hypothetical protein